MATKKNALEELGISKEEVLKLLAEEAKAAKAPKKDPRLQELVPMKLFKDGREYKDDQVVIVNGESCVVQRGKEVMIKRKYAQVLNQSMDQDVRAAEVSDQYRDEYKQAQQKFE